MNRPLNQSPFGPPGAGEMSLAPAAAVKPSARNAGSQCDPPKPSRLLDRVREAIRVRHYSIRTEAPYLDWIRRFILFHGKQHPQDLGSPEVAAILTHLAVNRHVAPSTQNQAKSALLFLYREVLRVELPGLDEVTAAKDRRRLPVVLTTMEVRALLHELSSTTELAAGLLYGTGMRLLEALRLRVNDVGCERREVLVRDGRGGKDRVTVLPENLVLPLQQQMAHAKLCTTRISLAGTVWCGCPMR